MWVPTRRQPNLAMLRVLLKKLTSCARLGDTVDRIYAGSTHHTQRWHISPAIGAQIISFNHLC